MPAATVSRPDPFATLNDAQRAAVEHGIGAVAGQGATAGPLLVIAGAGTGKTMTLASRVARLVLAGADPQRILLLTFSRRAAQEMERRCGRVLHAALGFGATQRAPSLPWAGTFHSIGARLLREVAGAIGLAPQFTIHDRGDAEDQMGLVRQQLGLAATEKRFPMKGTCLAIYSRVVNSQLPVEQVVQALYPWCLGWEDELKRLFRAYVHDKQQQQVLDYDDLLLYWQQAMAEPALAAAIGARFDHVLVDEYQDTNRLQAAILKALKPDGRGLTVVGDDAQSIYAFRAAEVRNILDFPAQFEPPAQVVTLSRNYRSTQAILDASNAVIALAAERFTKDLWTEQAGERPRLVTVADEMAQARWVADAVLLHREGGLALKRQAVLFRSAHHSDLLEVELTRRNIPYVKHGGLKFLEAAHVKDLLGVLRWAENPRNGIAAFRTLQLMSGIGPAHAQRCLEHLAGAATFEALGTFDAPAAARHEWSGFVALMSALAAPDARWAGQVDEARRWYQPLLERRFDDAAVRAADLDMLATVAASFGTRERFLTELTLDPPSATGDLAGDPLLDEDYLVLSTVHSAKGQEWDAVYVLNVADGNFPNEYATGSAASIEEERRLLYVAITRARDTLALLEPQRYYVTQQTRLGDRYVHGARSRFLTERVLGCLERVGPPADAARPGPPAAGTPGAPPVRVDVAGSVRSMW